MNKKKTPYESTLLEVIDFIPTDVISTSAQGSGSPFGDEENMDNAWT